MKHRYSMITYDTVEVMRSERIIAPHRSSEPNKSGDAIEPNRISYRIVFDQTRPNRTRAGRIAPHHTADHARKKKIMQI